MIKDILFFDRELTPEEIVQLNRALRGKRIERNHKLAEIVVEVSLYVIYATLGLLMGYFTCGGKL